MSDMGYLGDYRPTPAGFLTNFEERMRPAYVEAVKRYQGGSVFRVDEKALDLNNYGGSLWWADKARWHDTGEFFRLLKAVRLEMGLKYHADERL